MRRSRFQPCVYVVAARDFRVKVGVSALLSRRLAQLSACEGEPLTVVHRLDFPTMRLARRVETEAKTMLHAFQIEGEWFAVLRSAAVAAVNDGACRVVAPTDVAEVAPAAERVRAALSEDIAVMKAARRMLNWTVEELAGKAGVSVATIKNIERGTTDARASTINAIRAALTTAGAIFMEPGDMRTGGKGVRFR